MKRPARVSSFAPQMEASPEFDESPDSSMPSHCSDMPAEKRQRAESHPSGPDSIPRGVAKLLFQTLSGEEKKLLSRGLSALGSELRIFTGCSGSEVQQHCGSMMLELMSGGSVHYRTIASCENDKRKQRWILEVVNADCELKVKPHLFEDLKAIHQAVAHCVAHDRRCDVPGRDHVNSPHIALMSFSCKDLSRLKKGWQDLSQHVLNNVKTSTGMTFQAIVMYLSEHRPPIYVGENLQNLVTSSQCSSDLEDALHGIGYVCKVRVLFSSHFQSPQKRQRSFIVAFEIWNSGLSPEYARGCLGRVFDKMECIRLPEKPLEDFLLVSEDPYINQQRDTMLKNKMPDKGSTSSWMPKYNEFMEHKKLKPRECIPNGHQRSSSWYPILCERERVVLGFTLKVKPETAACNVSQRIQQASASDGPDLNTLTHTQRVWLPRIAEPRLLLGREALSSKGGTAMR